MDGIYFGNIHSYRDLNLILSAIDIPPAAVKTHYVDIPGADGSVDLTETFGKSRLFHEDRVCYFTFTVFPYEDFEEKKRQAGRIFGGWRYQIVLDKDPGFYWEGRCFVDAYASDRNLRQIVVRAIVAPYRMRVSETHVAVGPNPPGEILTAPIENPGVKWVIPKITVTEDAVIRCGDVGYTLTPGTYLADKLLFPGGGITIVSVLSEAPVIFKFREGYL